MYKKSLCTCKVVVLRNKPIAFLTSSLPTPSSLLELPKATTTATATKTSLNLRCFKLHRASSFSFNSSNIGKMFWSLILNDYIKVQEKKKEVVVLCSRTRQSVKLGTFTF